jgi:hypothetical protein
MKKNTLGDGRMITLCIRLSQSTIDALEERRRLDGESRGTIVERALRMHLGCEPVEVKRERGFNRERARAAIAKRWGKVDSNTDPS